MDFFIFGVLGYALAAFGFFVSDDQRTKLFLVFACASNMMYFALNDMLISASIVALTGVRMGVSMIFRHWTVGVFFIFVAATTPLLVNSNDWISIIPGITGTIAAYWLTGTRMRVMFMVGAAAWVVNNAIAGAWIGVAGEILLIAAGISGLMQSNSGPSPASILRGQMSILAKERIQEDKSDSHSERTDSTSSAH